MTNTDTRLAGYKARALELETTKRVAAEDLRELWKEMKGNGISKVEIKGVKIAVQRDFISDDKLAKQAAERTEAEAVADMLAASGDAPLFGAVA